MATLTYLRSIANNTPYTLTLVDGEDHAHSLAVGAQNVWNGSLAIPWIGRTGENNKAMHLILGPSADAHIWLFQDYWNPADENAIKYLAGSDMNYASDHVKEVDGYNRGGGSKNLIISLVNRDFRLYMA